MTDKKIIHSLIEQELKEANEKFPQFASDHEAFAAVLEEFQETKEELEGCENALTLIWGQVRENDGTDELYFVMESYAVNLIQEAIQLAAMCRKARAV